MLWYCDVIKYICKKGKTHMSAVWLGMPYSGESKINNWTPLEFPLHWLTS